MKIKIIFIALFFFNISLYSQQGTISKEYIENNISSRGFNDFTFIGENNNTNYFHTRIGFGEGEEKPILIAVHKIKNNLPILNLAIDVAYSEQVKKYNPNRYKEALYYKYLDYNKEEKNLLELIFSSKFSTMETDYLKMLGKNRISIYHYVEDVFFYWDSDIKKVASPLIISSLIHAFDFDKDKFDWSLEQVVTVYKLDYTLQANTVNEALIIGRVLTTKEKNQEARQKAIKQRQEELSLSEFEFKDPTSWDSYQSQADLLKNIYNGNFDEVTNDAYFQHLYVTYIYNMSYNCQSLLPANKKDIVITYTTVNTVKNGVLVTGMKSMPFIDSYTNQSSTTKVKVTLDPRFENVFRSYSNRKHKDTASNIIFSAIMNKGDGLDFLYELINIDNFLRDEKCNKKSLNQLGENILRFANGEVSLQNEGRTKK